MLKPEGIGKFQPRQERESRLCIPYPPAAPIVHEEHAEKNRERPKFSFGRAHARVRTFAQEPCRGNYSAEISTESGTLVHDYMRRSDKCKGFPLWKAFDCSHSCHWEPMQGRLQTAPPSPRCKGRQKERATPTITTATNSVFHSRLQENNNNIKRVVDSVKRITLFWSAVSFRDVNGTRTLRQKPFLQYNDNRTDNDTNVRLRATACRITRLWSGGPLTLPQNLADANPCCARA